MKTKLFLAAMVFAANCTIANAQVLGGSAVGGVGGSLGGGLGGSRDIGAMGHGAANGAFGADVGTGSLRRTTGEVAGRASNRTRSTLDSTRARTRSTVNSASEVSQSAATTTRDHAATAASSAQSAATWSARSGIDAGQGTVATANSAKGTADIAGEMGSNANFGATPAAVEPSAPSPSLSGAVNESAGAQMQGDGDRLPIGTSGDASASGNASASKDEVRANGTASGSGQLTLGN